MNHVRLQAHYAPDLRDWRRSTGGAVLSIRLRIHRGRAAYRHGRARHHIPNIGLTLWRVRAFPLTRSPAVEDPDIGGGLRFRFNRSGRMALYNTPETETEIRIWLSPIMCHCRLPAAG